MDSWVDAKVMGFNGRCGTCGRVHEVKEVTVTASYIDAGTLHLVFGCLSGEQMKKDLREFGKANKTLNGDSGRNPIKKQAYEAFVRDMGPDEYGLVRPWYDKAMDMPELIDSLIALIVTYATHTNSKWRAQFERPLALNTGRE